MICLLYFLITHQAAGPQELNEKQLRQLDTFVSNFAEASMGDFSTSGPKDIQMAEFAYFHCIWNESKFSTNHGGFGSLSRDNADRIAIRFFNKRISDHAHTHSLLYKKYGPNTEYEWQELERKSWKSGNYAWAYGDGDEPNVARVFKVSGNYPANFTIHSIDFRANAHGAQTRADYDIASYHVQTAKASPTEKGRFILTSRRSIDKKSMLKAIGASSIRMPRIP